MHERPFEINPGQPGAGQGGSVHQTAAEFQTFHQIVDRGGGECRQKSICLSPLFQKDGHFLISRPVQLDGLVSGTAVKVILKKHIFHYPVINYGCQYDIR